MVTVRFRALLALPALAGALLLSGCGDPATEPGSGGTDPTATARPTGVPPTVAPTKPVPPPGSDVPTASGRPITVDGIIEEGVEPGCKVLAAGGTSYQILGGGADVPVGVPVRVEGVLTPGVLSTCQQGTPLRVTTVKRR
jgi:hypothetical protein